MTTRRQSCDSVDWTSPEMEAAASSAATGHETLLRGSGENAVQAALQNKEEVNPTDDNITSTCTKDETTVCSTSVTTGRETEGRSSVTIWSSPDMEAAAAMASAKHGDELVSQLAPTRKGFTPPSSLSTALPPSSEDGAAPSAADSKSIATKSDTAKRPSVPSIEPPPMDAVEEEVPSLSHNSSLSSGGGTIPLPRGRPAVRTTRTIVAGGGQAPRSTRGAGFGRFGPSLTSSRMFWLKSRRGWRGPVATTTTTTAAAVQQKKNLSSPEVSSAMTNNDDEPSSQHDADASSVNVSVSSSSSPPSHQFTKKMRAGGDKQSGAFVPGAVSVGGTESSISSSLKPHDGSSTTATGIAASDRFAKKLRGFNGSDRGGASSPRAVRVGGSRRSGGAASPSERFAEKFRGNNNSNLDASRPGAAWVVGASSSKYGASSALMGDAVRQFGQKSKPSNFAQPTSRGEWTKKRRPVSTGPTAAAAATAEVPDGSEGGSWTSSSPAKRGTTATTSPPRLYVPRDRLADKVRRYARDGSGGEENSLQTFPTPGAVKAVGGGDGSNDAIEGKHPISVASKLFIAGFSQPTSRQGWLTGRQRKSSSNDANAHFDNAMDMEGSTPEGGGDGTNAASTSGVTDRHHLSGGEDYYNDDDAYDEHFGVIHEDEGNFPNSDRVSGHEQDYHNNLRNLPHPGGAASSINPIREEEESLMREDYTEAEIYTVAPLPDEAPVTLHGKDDFRLVTSKKRRRRLIVTLVTLVVVGIIVGVSVAVAGGSDGGGGSSLQNEDSIQAVPTMSPTVNPEICFGAEPGGATSERYSMVRTELQSMYTGTSFDVPNTAQRMALCWLADFDRLQVDLSDVSLWHQRYVLSVLFYSLVNQDDPEGLALTSNWLSALPECDWDYVNCSNVNAITELHLDEKSLKGVIPDEITELSFLRILDLRINDISGSLSTFIGSMGSLTSMQLNRNSINGTIPTEVGRLTQLVVLNLPDNRISGTIPTSIGQLSNLESIDLSSNRMSRGSIPTELFRLRALETLLLRSCELTGTLPSLVGQLTNLEVLSLQYNNINGTIPSEIGDAVSLITLFLNDNRFTGTIPEKLANLVNAVTIYLEFNELTGAMPAGVCALRDAATTNLLALAADCMGAEVTCPFPSCCTRCH